MTIFKAFQALGAAPQGARLARILRSPQARSGQFTNQGSTATMTPGSFWKTLGRMLFARGQRTPPGTVPVRMLDRSAFAAPPESGLRATWLGHAAVLLEIDGQNVLIDPALSKRVSPSQWFGPRRFHPVPLSLEDLPRLDVILLSHDHYDHLDMLTVQKLLELQPEAKYVTPLGVGAHLEHWGVPADRITELDWTEETGIGGLSFTAAKAWHFSGRYRRNDTLWCSWIIKGPRARVFYSGDSGWFEGFAEIGAAHGPFDLSIFTIGAYDAGWKAIHFTPEEALRAHNQLNSKLLLPTHWGTFNLAFHPWNEPPQRMLTAAHSEKTAIIIPVPGQSFEPAVPPDTEPWWQSL